MPVIQVQDGKLLTVCIVVFVVCRVLQWLESPWEGDE